MSESSLEARVQEELEARHLKALEWIDRLKQEPFNLVTEEKLAHHPFLKAAENDTLTMEQKRAFVCEQLAIQRSDAISFARLAGHKKFAPKSLASIKEAPPAKNEPFYKDHPDLFQFLLGGEIYAANLLLDHAQYLGLEDETAIQSAQPTTALGQAYPSYWARLALNKQRAAGAAACAVNFPAWGTMCGRVAKSVAYTGGSASALYSKELAFLRFFANPIDNLNEMAAAIMMQDEDITYQEVKEHVRLLQEYEVLFWDACYNAK